MRYFIYILIAGFLSVISVNNAFSQNRYWVNGSGSWDDPAHWALVSGGEPGASVPTAEDHVFFDDKSFTSDNQVVLLKDKAICKDFNWNVENHKPTLKSKSFLFKSSTKANLQLHGSLNINENIQNEFYGDFVFKSNEKSTIYLQKEINSNLIFDSETGDWKFLTDVVTSSNINIITGNVNLNDKAINCNEFISSSNKKRSIRFGSSEIIVDKVDLENASTLNHFNENINIQLRKNISDRNVKLGAFPVSLSKAGFKASLTIEDVVENDAKCYGDTGGIFISVSGGTKPYKYTLYDYNNPPTLTKITDVSKADTTHYFGGLFAGDYVIRVEDSGVGLQQDGPFTVGQPAEFKANNILINQGLSCYDSEDAILEADPSGGTPPYSYQWQKDDGGWIDIPGATNKILNGIGQGTYQVVIKDQNDCGPDGSVKAQLIFKKLFEPTYIPDSITITSVDVEMPCAGANDGTIQINASGGTGDLDYSLDPAGLVGYQDGNLFTGLGPAVYGIWVMDENGCKKQNPDETLTELANPTATIDPAGPIDLCPGEPQTLDGNAVHGDGTSFISHLWTGTGDTYLNNTGIETPVFTSSDVGSYNLTYTVTDDNGCQGNDVVTINVDDTDAPTPVCQDITVYLDATGNITITGEQVDNGSTDNCSDPGDLIFTVVPNSFDCSDIGINPVTLTVTDELGNSDNCLANVTVADNTAPSITCPGNLIVSNNPGNCTAIVNGLAPTTSDNCGVVLQTWTMSGATVASSPGAGINDVSGSTFNSGITTVTYRVEDASGNSAQCSFTVTVNDTEPPTITCPGNVAASTSNDGTGNCSTTVGLGSPITSDNCGVSSIIAQVGGSTINPVTYQFPVGITTVTWIAQDAAGNTASCAQTVTIVDDENPTIACPTNITANSSDNGSGDCSTTAALGSPVTSDNCGVSSVIAQVGGSTINPATYQFPVGITTVTWIVEDAAGNSANCNQTVTVVDDENPTITCPSDVSVNSSDNGIGDCSTTVALGSPVTVDNCGVSSVIAQVGGSTINPATYQFPVGITTVSWIVEDAAGNTASCEQIVTVIDDEIPTIICPADIIANSSDNGTGDCSTTVAIGSPVTSDNCGVSSVIAQVGGSTINPVTYQFSVGITTVTWIVEDLAGNTVSCNQSVTVIDDENPNVACQDITIQLDATGNATITANDINAGSSDNCGISSISASQTVFTCADLGSNLITLTVTDNSGNTANCIATVTVEDNIAPTITCPADVSIEQDGGCDAVVNGIAPVTNDNCGIVLQTWSMSGATSNSSPVAGINDASGETFNIGVTTVEYYIEDASGNLANCSFTVEVYDVVYGGLIDADQTVCYNTTPLPFTNEASASVCGGFTYQWQMKSGAGAWADIPGATNETYTELNPLTEVTYYNRKAISDLGFGTAYSDTIVMTIQPEATAFAGADVTLCYGESYQIPDADTTNASSVYWEILTGNGTFNPVLANTIDPEYIPDATDGGTVVELVLHAVGIGPCGESTDTIRLNYLNELLVAIGKPSPFPIDSTSTEIDVYFKISSHRYASLIGLYLVSPLDSVVELKPYCTNIGSITPTQNLTVEFNNDPQGTSGLSTISACAPTDGQYLFSGEWKKKLHGQDPANGSWRVMIKDTLNFGAPGVLEEATITFSDFNYEGTYESVLYADSSINLNINGHPGSGPATITEYALPITGLTTSCFGVCDATAVATASGGQPPYLTYEWSTSSDFSTIYATGDTVDLCAGKFYVRVIDSNGCMAIDSVNVGEPPEIFITSDSVIHNQCNGSADGKVVLEFTGGTGLLQYTYNGTDWYNSGDTIANLAAATYTFTIQDISGCTKDTVITINEPTPIDITTNVTGISCYGQADASIEIIATGGTPGIVTPYQYSIDSADTWHTNNVFTPLDEGRYIIVVQDSLGCLAYGDTIDLVNPAPISIDSVQATAITCNGNGADGTITVYATGGTGTLEYSLDKTNYQTSNVFTDLIPGTYSIYVTDDCNIDSLIDGAVVSDVVPVEISVVDINDVSTCYGDNTGQIVIKAIGGSGVYEYSINGGTDYQPEDTFKFLSARSYTLLVRDDDGCLSEDSVVTVNQPDELLITGVNVTHASECNASTNTGIIEITATGGTIATSYLYSITGYTSQQSPTFSGLDLGDYTVIVEDDNGCQATLDTSIVLLEAMTIALNPVDITCNGQDDGSITVDVTNGKLPYTSFEWTGPNGFTSSALSINNLEPGTYSVTVTDGNTPTPCVAESSVEIIEPEILQADITVKDKFCVASDPIDPVLAQGAINADGLGGTPTYNYSWVGPSGFTSASDYLTNLDPGVYSLTLTDVNGCTFTKDTTVQSNDEFDLSALDITVEDPSVCWNEEIKLIANFTGFADTIYYQISQNIGGFWEAFQMKAGVVNNPAEVTQYIQGDARIEIVRVENDYCKESVTTNLNIEFFPSFNLDIVDYDNNAMDDTLKLIGVNQGELTASVLDETGLNFDWTPSEWLSSPSSKTTVIKPEDSGWFTVVATSDDGCVDSSSIYVQFIPAIKPQKGFSPNGDGVNDYWTIKYIDNFVLNEVVVFNRWGVKVYEQKGYNNDDPDRRWDGKSKSGNDLPSGTYYYVIKLNDQKFAPITGPITIVR